MKSLVKPVVLFCIIFTMLAAITACGTTTAPTAAPATAPAQDISAPAAAEPTVTVSTEPVTLKMFIRNQSKYTGVQEDPVAKLIEQKLGIIIDLTVDSSLGNTSAQTSSFNDLLASKLASNDLDDIMDFGAPTGNPDIMSNLLKAAESGMIIPLDDLVANNTNGLGSDPRLILRNDYRKQFIFPDGKLYSIGAWGGFGLDQLPGSANWVRWDLYKQMGYPEVKSDDEFLAMLQQMLKLYPKTSAGETVYGLGGGFADQKGMGDGFINREYPMTKGYEPLEGNYAVYINHATQQVVAPLLDTASFFWNGVKLYYNANKMGLLDPGAMAMSGSDYFEKIKKGIYLASLNGWAMNNRESTLESLGIKDAGYMPVKFLDDVQAFTIYWEAMFGIDEFTITKVCMNPKKAIELLDWCMSEEGSRDLTQGAEGVAWEMRDGVPTITEKFKTDSASGIVDMAETYGTWKYAGINAFQHIDFDSNGYYIMPSQIPNPASYSAIKKDALGYYGADSFSDYFTNYANRSGQKLPNVVWAAFTGAIGPKPDNIKQKSAAINDYMFKAVFKLIYAKDDAEYQSIQADTINTLTTMGVDDVVKWYQDQFVQIHKDIDPLIVKAKSAYKIN